MKQLLVEKYRPKTIDGYVFNNEDTKRKVSKWVKEQEIPNVLLSGSAGTGKSTLARILVNELGIQDSDVLKFNGSSENGIGFVREVLEPFCKRAAFSNFKIIIGEEIDQLTKSAALSLRDITEAYSDRVRWIFTCNHPEKIHPALLSRFQHIHINEHDEEGIVNLILDIIEAEGIIVEDEDVLFSHIDAYAHDIRKIINSIDEYTDEDNILHKLSEAVSGVDMDEWVSLWQSDKTLDIDAAMAFTGAIDLNNFESFYEIMYNNSHKFPNEERGIVLLSKYLDRALRAANQSLHLKAFLIEAFLMGEDDE